MNKFGAFLKRRDSFGEPVTINFGGEAVFNTIIGGVLTLAVNIFILTVATIGVIDLF